MNMRLAVIALLAGVTALWGQSPAATYVASLPDLIGECTVPYELSVVKTSAFDAHVHFQSVTQIRVHLAGELLPSFIEDWAGGWREALTMRFDVAGCTIYSHVSSGQPGITWAFPFDRTIALPLPTGSKYDQLLQGQGSISMSLIYEMPGAWIPESTIVPPSADVSVAMIEIDGVAVPGTLVGDCNGDGYANVGDLQVVVAGWGKSSTDQDYDANADVNHDGSVNVADLQLLVANWGNPR